MKRLLKLAATLAVVALCGAAGLWGTELLLPDEEAQSEGQGGPDATRVTTTRPERREVPDVARAIGTVYPRRSVALRPVSAGRVGAVFVSSGERIMRGQSVLALDARAARAAFARAEATRDETRQEQRRIEELASENVAAEARLEEAAAAAARAEAELDAARAALEDRRLDAPFAGTLGIVTIDPGEYVDPATTITTLDDISAVEISFALPERYYPRVTPGQTVRLGSTAYPGRDFEGTVAVRGTSIDPASRSFEVRATLDNPDRALVGGMFVEAEIVFARDEALTVPDDAVVGEGRRSFVFTVVDGTARRTEIGLGRRVGPRVEVTEGLDADARIVVTGGSDLSDGDPVTVAGDAAGEAID